MGNDALVTKPLLNEIAMLRKRVTQLEKQLSDASWAREGQRDYEQEERGRWGIYG